MKKMFAFTVALIAACALWISAAAAEAVEIKMTIGDMNGYVKGEVKTLDAAPVIRQDRTMLPVRFVAENLGASVAWDGATATATITSGSTEIKITIGAAEAVVRGEIKILDAPAIYRKFPHISARALCSGNARRICGLGRRVEYGDDHKAGGCRRAGESRNSCADGTVRFEYIYRREFACTGVYARLH